MTTDTTRRQRPDRHEHLTPREALDGLRADRQHFADEIRKHRRLDDMAPGCGFADEAKRLRRRAARLPHINANELHDTGTRIVAECDAYRIPDCTLDDGYSMCGTEDALGERNEAQRQRGRGYMVVARALRLKDSRHTDAFTATPWHLFDRDDREHAERTAKALAIRTGTRMFVWDTRDNMVVGDAKPRDHAVAVFGWCGRHGHSQEFHMDACLCPACEDREELAYREACADDDRRHPDYGDNPYYGDLTAEG